jgi:hypothetical protein
MSKTYRFENQSDAIVSWNWIKSNPVAYSVSEIRFSKSSEVYYFDVRQWRLD